MLQDVERGRSLELDALLGTVELARISHRPASTRSTPARRCLQPLAQQGRLEVQPKCGAAARCGRGRLSCAENDCARLPGALRCSRLGQL
jgi:hypothetical protein